MKANQLIVPEPRWPIGKGHTDGCFQTKGRELIHDWGEGQS
jgi:hypothetical protein